MRGARGSKRCAQAGVGGMQRQRQRRLHAAQRQPLEHPGIADGGKHQVLVADAARRAEQVDRLEHGVQVVRRLAHAHEHHLVHAARARAPAPPGRRSRRCPAGAAGRPGRSCRRRSRPRSPPASTRTGRRAAAARFPPSGRRPAAAAAAASRPRRHARNAAAPAPSSSACSAGSAWRSASGRKSSMRRRPASCGRARVQWRSTRSSCSGLAPAARSRRRMSSICMGNIMPATGRDRPLCRLGLRRFRAVHRLDRGGVLLGNAAALDLHRGGDFAVVMVQLLGQQVELAHLLHLRKARVDRGRPRPAPVRARARARPGCGSGCSPGRCSSAHLPTVSKSIWISAATKGRRSATTMASLM